MKKGSQIPEGSKAKADKANASPEVFLSGTPSPPPQHFLTCNFLRKKDALPRKMVLFNHVIMTGFLVLSCMFPENETFSIVKIRSKPPKRDEKERKRRSPSPRPTKVHVGRLTRNVTKVMACSPVISSLHIFCEDVWVALLKFSKCFVLLECCQGVGVGNSCFVSKLLSEENFGRILLRQIQCRLLRLRGA